MGLQFLELNELCSLENEIRRRIFSSHFSIIWCNFSGLLQHFVCMLPMLKLKSFDCQEPRSWLPTGHEIILRNIDQSQFRSQGCSTPFGSNVSTTPKLPKLRDRPSDFNSDSKQVIFGNIKPKEGKVVNTMLFVDSSEIYYMPFTKGNLQFIGPIIKIID